jgi:hypothetical protein
MGGKRLKTSPLICVREMAKTSQITVPNRTDEATGGAYNARNPCVKEFPLSGLRVQGRSPQPSSTTNRFLM